MTTPLWLSRLRPEELLFHERLFLAADTGRENAIGGAQAVAFFGRTGLPVTTLKQVWTLAATASQSSLSRAEFSVALRLVALAQQGHDLSSSSVLQETDATPLAMPRFAEEPLDPHSYAMTDVDEGRYNAIFDSMGADARGLVPRDSAMELFAKSGLSINELTELVLSVQTLQLQPDAALVHRHEFALVMHLIVCRTKRELRSLPLEFPKYLFPQLSQPSWLPGKTNTMQQPAAATAWENSFDLADGFTASLRPPEKLLSVPALTDLLEHQNTNVAQLASLAERLISSEEEAHRNLERYLQDLVCQLQDLVIVIPPSLTGDISLTTVDELRTVIVQQIQAVQQDIEQMNRTASGRERSSDSVLGAIPALMEELEALKSQSRQLEDKKRSLYAQLTERASISISSTAASRTGSRYESLTINTFKSEPAAHSSQPQEPFNAAFESPRLEAPARSLFSPTPGDGDVAADFGSPTAAAWGDFNTAAAELIQSPSSAFGDFAGASSPSSAWSPRADGFGSFADEPKNASTSPSLLVFSPTDSGAAAGDKPTSNRFFGEDSTSSAPVAASAVDSDSSLLSLDSMMDFYPPRPKDTVPVFDVFALAEASTFSALDAGNDIDVNVLEVVPDFAQSAQEAITPAPTEPSSTKASGRTHAVEAARSSLSSVQLQSPVASAPRAPIDFSSANESPSTAPVSSGADFGTFDAFPASFDAALADASVASGDFAFPSFGDSTQASNDSAPGEWAATSFGDFSAASGDNSNTTEASKTGFGDFNSAFDSPAAAGGGFAATTSDDFGGFGTFEASGQADQTAADSWGNFDAFQAKDDAQSSGNGFGTFGDFNSAEQNPEIAPSDLSGGANTNGLGNDVNIEKVQDQPPASLVDLSGGFGYFTDSRTASATDSLPVFGDFDTSTEKSATVTDDQESFGVFSDSRTTSHSDLPVNKEMPFDQPVFGALDSFSEQASDSSSSFGFSDFVPTPVSELTPNQSDATQAPIARSTASFGESSTGGFGSFGDFNESLESGASTDNFPSFSDDAQPTSFGQQESFDFPTESASSPDISAGTSSFEAFGAFGSDYAAPIPEEAAEVPRTVESTTTASFSHESLPPVDAQESFESRTSSIKDSGVQFIPEVSSAAEVVSASTEQPFETSMLASEVQEFGSHETLDAADSFSVSGEVNSSEDTSLAAKIVQETSPDFSDVKSGPSAGEFGDFGFSSPPVSSMALGEQTYENAQEVTFSSTQLQDSHKDSSHFSDFSSVATADEITDSVVTVETVSSDSVQQASSESTESAAVAVAGNESTFGSTSFGNFGSFDASFAPSMTSTAAVEPVESISFGDFAAASTAPTPTLVDLSSDFGFFGDSRTNSQTNIVSNFGDFASFESHVQAPENDQESFGFFSDSRSASFNSGAVVVETPAAESNDAFKDFSAPVEPATSASVAPYTSADDAFQDFSAPTQAASSEYLMHEMSAMNALETFSAPVGTASSESATIQDATADSFHAVPSESLTIDASQMESFDAFPSPVVAAVPSESSVSEVSAIDSFQPFADPITESTLSAEISTISMTESVDQPILDGSSKESHVAAGELSVSNTETQPIEGRTSTEQAHFEAFDSSQHSSASTFEVAESSSTGVVQSDTFGSIEAHVQASDHENSIANSGPEAVADVESFSTFGHFSHASAETTTDLSAFDSFESHAEPSEHTTGAENTGNDITPDFEAFDAFSQHSEAAAATGEFSEQMQTEELDAPSSADFASNSFQTDSVAQQFSTMGMTEADESTLIGSSTEFEVVTNELSASCTTHDTETIEEQTSTDQATFEATTAAGAFDEAVNASMSVAESDTFGSSESHAQTSEHETATVVSGGEVVTTFESFSDFGPPANVSAETTPELSSFSDFKSHVEPPQHAIGAVKSGSNDFGAFNGFSQNPEATEIEKPFPVPVVAAAPSESTVGEISVCASLQVPVTESTLSADFDTMSMTESVNQPTFAASNKEAQVATDELSVSSTDHQSEPVEGETSTEQDIQTSIAGEVESSSTSAFQSDTFGSFESHAQRETAAVNSGVEVVADFESFSAFEDSANASPEANSELSAFGSFESHIEQREAVNSSSGVDPDLEAFDDFSQHSEAATATTTEESSFTLEPPNESGGSFDQTQATEQDASSAEVTSTSFGSDAAAHFESFESVTKTDDFTDFSEGGFASESAARSDGESDGNFVMVSDPGSSCDDVDAFADGSPSSEDCDFQACDDSMKTSAELNEELEISVASSASEITVDTATESDLFSPSELESVDATGAVIMGDDEFEQMLEMTPSAAADGYLNRSAEDVAKDIDDLLSDGEQTDAAAADASETPTMDQVDSELDAALSSESVAAAPVV